MWQELGRSLGVELEYLFILMAEAAMPDQLWQPEIIQPTHTPPIQH
jgi:hypothetical protein